MPTTLNLPDDRVLEIITEQIEVTTMGPVPDEDWAYTDGAGHRHYREGNGYPTLRWVVDAPAYTDDDGEEYPETGHHECPLCGEHVPPGVVLSPPWRRFIPGPTSFYLDGEPITAEEAQALIDAAREAG